MERDLGFAVGRVYSFERVSSRLQTKGVGLERQSTSAQEWCDRHGLDLDDELRLSDPGRSAFHGEHLRSGGPLKTLIELAEAGKLGPDPVLLVEAVDRVSRLHPVRGLQQVFFALITAGVTIVTLEDEVFYNMASTEHDASQVVMLALKCQAAYEYSKRLSRRQTFNWSKVRESLKDGQIVRPKQYCPSWCDYSETKGFVFNEKAPGVIKALELLRAHGYTAVAKMLNEQGYPPLKGSSWTVGSLSALVKNSHQLYGAIKVRPRNAWKKLERDAMGRATDPRAQAGVVRGGAAEPGEVIEGLLPPLLSRQQVEEIRALVSARHRKGSHPGPNTQMHWIGRGLTRCVCGGSMTTCVGGHPPHHLIRYLACRARASSEVCRRPYLPMRDVAAVVLVRLSPEALAHLAGSSNGAEHAAALRLRLEQAASQEAALQQQLENVSEQLKLDARSGTGMAALLMEAYRDAATELEGVQQQLADLRAELTASSSPLPLETVEQVIEPLRAQLLRDESERDLRYRVNAALRQLGLRIVIDSEAMTMGLAIGEGELDWQPINFNAAWAALSQGLGGAVMQRTGQADFAVSAAA